MIKIIEYLKLLSTKNKTLTLALIVSLLVHILLLSKFQFKLPEQDEAQQAINVRLVNVQPMQKATSTPTNNASQEPLASPEQPKIKLEVSPIAAPITIQPVNQAAVNSTATETVTTNETSEITASTEIVGVAKKPVSVAYKNIETEFEVRRDNDISVAGLTRISFNINSNGTYMLTSITEGRGLASLFLGTLVQQSEGVVLDDGLRPNFYTYQYGSNDKNMQSANFAWSDGIIEMNSENGKKTENVIAGTQDSLSFMYQFMFTPPTELSEITMANGKDLRTYSYSFQGEDLTPTKLGALKTIHLLKSGDANEKTELWLAIDYQYLPVKIRKTEKDGSFIEQTATKISTIPP